MKTSRLKEIIGIVEQADIDVLHIEENDFTLYYQKNGTTPVIDAGKNIPHVTELAETREEMSGSPEEEYAHTPHAVQTEEITSPMIGTFYSCSEPDADSYVQIGSIVTKGDTVCVLEAMKLMNEVTSTVDGEIVDILVQDGDVIEYGQPLFTVRVGE